MVSFFPSQTLQIRQVLGNLMKEICNISKHTINILTHLPNEDQHKYNHPTPILREVHKENNYYLYLMSKIHLATFTKAQLNASLQNTTIYTIYYGQNTKPTLGHPSPKLCSYLKKYKRCICTPTIRTSPLKTHPQNLNREVHLATPHSPANKNKLPQNTSTNYTYTTSPPSNKSRIPPQTKS